MSARVTGLLGALSVLQSSPLALAHGGGLDSCGCHHDQNAGGHHCHRGVFGGQSFGSQEMLKIPDAKRNTPAAQNGEQKK